METNARYTLIGLFSLAVIGAGFAFVYWLQTTGGLGARTQYKVRFESPVSGLLVGSAVLFNGIRVGEVIALELSDKNPKEVNAAIGVDPATPVRADTQVGIDFQGLTGAPVILLTGGSPGAPLLSAQGGEPAVLTADPQAGQSLSQAARESLRRLDGILADNAAPLHEAITSISTFSNALARNSDKVDGIVAGLDRLTGGGAAKAKMPIYELAPAPAPAACPVKVEGQLVIPEPTALLALNTDKILVAEADGSAPPLENAQWADAIPVLMQAKLIASFENSGCFRSINRPTDTLEADFQLLTEIRAFKFTSAPTPEATIEISARILGSGGKVVDARVFRETAAAPTSTAGDVVAAYNDAFAKLGTALELWTAEATAKQPAEPKP